MADALAALIGDNNPPPDLLIGEALHERLRDENADLLKRRDDLLAAGARVPAINNDDTAGKVSDYVKQLTALAKTASRNQSRRSGRSSMPGWRGRRICSIRWCGRWGRGKQGDDWLRKRQRSLKD